MSQIKAVRATLHLGGGVRMPMETGVCLLIQLAWGGGEASVPEKTLSES